MTTSVPTAALRVGRERQRRKVRQREKQKEVALRVRIERGRKRLERMGENFDKETARKDMAMRRPLNIRYTPQVGQEWTYFDAEDEGVVTWFIEKIEDGKAELVKKSGKDIGYRTM